MSQNKDIISKLKNLKNLASNVSKLYSISSSVIDYAQDGNEANLVKGTASNSNFNLLLGGNGSDTLWSKGHGNILLGGDGDDIISAQGSLSISIGGNGNDFIKSSGYLGFVDAGNGDDFILVEDVASKINAGDGDDRIELGGFKGGILSTLDGGSGNDTYVISTELLQLSNLYQKTYIDNNGDTNSTDTLLFGGQLSASDVTFQRFNNDDLAVGILGTNRNFILQDWYVNEFERIDEFKISSGSSLQQSQVENLVTAWDNFNTATINKSQLTTLIDNAWSNTLT